jgi:membrane-bound lytic murein transglycosylase MltF
MIFPSCTQERSLAGSRKMVPADIVSPAAAPPLRLHTKVGQDGTGDGEPVPESGPPPALRLDHSTERCIRNYGPAIKRYARRYGVDWRLVLAIMKQESRYSRTAESSRGAAGLMQLMPVTAGELARTLELEDLSPPDRNIQAGVFYLRKLYDLFDGAEEADRLKLSLAAYNAGFSRVHDAQELAVHLLDKPTQWAAVRNALPLLSKQFYTLHRTVWGQDRPRSGWFRNSRETIGYVDAVMDSYGVFMLSLN